MVELSFIFFLFKIYILPTVISLKNHLFAVKHLYSAITFKCIYINVYKHERGFSVLFSRFNPKNFTWYKTWNYKLQLIKILLYTVKNFAMGWTNFLCCKRCNHKMVKFPIFGAMVQLELNRLAWDFTMFWLQLL